MRKLHQIVGSALAIAALAFATPASADIACQFSISNLGFDGAGDVQGTFVNQGVSYYWVLCSTQGSVTTYSGYGATTWSSGACSALFSQLLTARVAGIQVWFVFHTVTACTAAGGLPGSGWLTGTSTSQTFPEAINY